MNIKHLIQFPYTKIVSFKAKGGQGGNNILSIDNLLAILLISCHLILPLCHFLNTLSHDQIDEFRGAMLDFCFGLFFDSLVIFTIFILFIDIICIFHYIPNNILRNMIRQLFFFLIIFLLCGI